MIPSSAESRTAAPPATAGAPAPAGTLGPRRRRWRPSPFVRGLLAGIVLVFAVRALINNTAIADRLVSRLIPSRHGRAGRRHRRARGRDRRSVRAQPQRHAPRAARRPALAPASCRDAVLHRRPPRGQGLSGRGGHERVRGRARRAGRRPAHRGGLAQHARERGVLGAAAAPARREADPGRHRSAAHAPGGRGVRRGRLRDRARLGAGLRLAPRQRLDADLRLPRVRRAPGTIATAAGWPARPGRAPPIGPRPT